MSQEFDKALKETTQHYLKKRDTFRVKLFQGVAERTERLFKELDKLTGKNYIDSFIKITNEVLPQLKAVEILGDGVSPMIIIDNAGKTIYKDSEDKVNG